MGHNSDRRVRKLAQVVKAEEPTCARCGQPIDPSLHWQDPMAFTMGHIIPKSQGGRDERRNVRAEHRRCNLRAGDRTTLVTPSEPWCV